MSGIKEFAVEVIAFLLFLAVLYFALWIVRWESKHRAFLAPNLHITRPQKTTTDLLHLTAALAQAESSEDRQSLPNAVGQLERSRMSSKAISHA